MDGCRIIGGIEYGRLATDYTRRFHGRWIEGAQRGDLLAHTAMTHIAIQESLDGKPVEWLEKVTDERYQARA